MKPMNRLLPAFILFVPTLSFAASPYLGISSAKTDTTVNDPYFDAEKTSSPKARFFSAGIQFNKFIDVEFRKGSGGTDTAPQTAMYAADMTIDDFHGFYLRGHLPINKVLSPYAIVGKTTGHVTIIFADNYNHDLPESSDTSTGFGLDINITKSFTLNIEKMKYIDIEGAKISATSFGISWRPDFHSKQTDTQPTTTSQQ